ncbi:thiamine pyrophosphate-dependent dehydrogenase E1 component subunit alpha [Sporichthya brevicatena]|uniref:Thiamine pyrophosphate-dependent dehydrogenase E1 component subunit alpha n=1 Tax=Sporichthya brevicatena TaxID=171442 RepID=A0ABN1HBX5_9ACTN
MSTSVDGAETPSSAQLREMYLTMKTITLADDRLREEVRAGGLNATFYPVRGLEAVCAAMGVVLRRTDYLVSTYRNLGDAVAKGASLDAIVAEAYGRITGTSKGKGGPMHLQDLEVGFMMTTGIVGSGLPIATGLGLASQLDGIDRVTLVTFGDGATSIGAFHEAMNLAALWRLPVVFLCQNNGWAEHTPVAEYAANPDFAGRAGGYGVTAYSVDGFDPVATWNTLRSAVDAVRAGGGPAFVECRTYRLSGHTGATDYSYMPATDFDAALARDPAPSFRAWLLERGEVDEAAAQEIDERAAALVNGAFEFAKSSPPPEPAEMFTDVFAMTAGV